jgi:hypothetical protein
MSALDVLHHEVEQPALELAEVDDAHHVVVRQPADRGRLAVEADHHLVVERQLRVQDLDGEAAPHPRVARPVDPAHAALAEHGLDHVATGERLPHQRIAGRLVEPRAVTRAMGHARAVERVAGRARPVSRGQVRRGQRRRAHRRHGPLDPGGCRAVVASSLHHVATAAGCTSEDASSGAVMVR